MTEPTTPRYADFIPYEPGRDPLKRERSGWRKVRIQDIPPTRRNDDSVSEEAPTDGQASKELKANLIEEFNSITVRSWWLRYFEKCLDRNLPFDVDRLFRLALCRNNVQFAQRLIREGADLTRLDIMGRSALFYGLWPFPDNDILTFYTSISQDIARMDVNRRDTEGKTPLQYALLLKSPAAVETLLSMNAEIDTDFKWNSRSEIEECIEVLLSCKILFARLPSHPGGFQYISSSYRMRTQDQSELSHGKTVWLHFVPLLGVVIFSFLGRCGREAARPIQAVITTSLTGGGDLYNGSFYVSNLLDYERTLNEEVYIVFPSLILRCKYHRLYVKKNIQIRKTNNPDYFTKTVFRSERTLDETYYPSLSAENLETRDNDQVVSREYPILSECRPGLEPILMVKNLWLRRIGRYILTTYSAQGDNFDVDFSSLMGNSYRPGIQIGTIIANHISSFGNRQYDGEFPPPLDIFEQAVVCIVQEVDKYVRNTAASSGLEMEKEHKFMFRIANIREGLVMIHEILLQQLNLVQNMIDDFENNDPDIRELLSLVPSSTSQQHELEYEHRERLQALKNWKKIKSSRGNVERFLKRVKKIDGDAERVEKRIQDQLNLKRTHASINDTRTSLRLGTAVIGFTVVTVIFAPLAFMTALLALPIDIFVRNQVLFDGTNGNSDTAGQADLTPTYTSGYVATWFVVAEILSLALTIFLVWICVWLLGGTESFMMMWARQPRRKEEVKKESEEESEEESDLSERGERSEMGSNRKGRKLDRLKVRAAAINDKVFSEPRKRINGLFRRRRAQGESEEV